MVVYICCAGGGTSSLLCKKISKVSKDNFKIYMDSIETIISDLKASNLSEYDLVLAYGPVGLLTKSFIEEYEIYNFIDLVFLAPQIRFEIKRVKTILTPYNIPVETIDMKTFGTMNGEKMLDEILTYKPSSIKI